MLVQMPPSSHRTFQRQSTTNNTKRKMDDETIDREERKREVSCYSFGTWPFRAILLTRLSITALLSGNFVCFLYHSGNFQLTAQIRPKKKGTPQKPRAGPERTHIRAVRRDRTSSASECRTKARKRSLKGPALRHVE
jgi:hypothetical protein